MSLENPKRNLKTEFDLEKTYLDGGEVGGDMIVLEVFCHFREATSFSEGKHRPRPFHADDVLLIDTESWTTITVHLTRTVHDVIGEVCSL